MNKFYSTLGLCRRAGRLLTGDALCEKAVRNNRAKLIILAADAAENTKKKYKDSCAYHGVKMVEEGTLFDLGHAVGREKLAVICILDEGFSKKLIDERERMDM